MKIWFFDEISSFHLPSSYIDLIVVKNIPANQSIPTGIVRALDRKKAAENMMMTTKALDVTE